MYSLSSLFRPEYRCRPWQVLRRIRHSLSRTQTPFATVKLPWDMEIRCRRNEHIGRALLRHGIYDLTVNETLWRLIEPGDVVVDVGANIGCMSATMLHRCAPKGELIAFEPNPAVFKELQYNLERWERRGCYENVSSFQQAVGKKAGRARIEVPPDFVGNRGLCRVAANGNAGSAASTAIGVEMRSLDEIFAERDKIALVKMDVEGYEASVLSGARKLLSGQRVRDWVFEVSDSSVSKLVEIFKTYGYCVYGLNRSFSGVGLSSDENNWNSTRQDGTPSMLATMAPHRAQEKFRSSGFQCLSRRHG